eukprot:TRINITY_DN33385_c0_g1_i1.p1 TRINITY_DN33385_c0_g1~~TRINITY_DN33385_c0_g1_i1.p1  ORF type:complete len:1041 (-),score=179.40 TRINITY_DN33385_c0_g1_i1:105-3227(-)
MKVKLDETVHKEIFAPASKLLLETKAFSRMSPSVATMLPQYMSFATYCDGAVLFRVGDPSESLYIVISGKADVYKPGVQADFQTRDFVSGDAGRHIASTISFLAEELGISNGDPEQGCEPPSPHGAREKHGVHMASLKAGLVFGEQGLLNECLRELTLICDGACEFLVVHKEDFMKVMKPELERIRLRDISEPIVSLLKEFQCFQQLETGVLEKVPPIIHHTRCLPGTVAFEEGDPPGMCYIVLSGRVSVYKACVESRPNQSTPKPNGNASACRFIASILEVLNTSVLASLADCFETQGGEHERQTNWGGEVASLGPGLIFGELALLTSEPRSATVVCSENCQFLTITRSDFDNILKQAMMGARMDLPVRSRLLVDSIPFFQSMAPFVRERVPHILQYSFVERGTLLFGEGDQPDCCYVLLCGQVGLWRRNVDVTKNNKKVESVEATPEIRAICADLVSAMASEEELQSLEQSSTADTQKRQALAESYLGYLQLILCAGATFGETSMIEDMPRNSSAYCRSNCLLLSISKRNFDEVIKEEFIKNKIKQLGVQVRRLLTAFPLFRDLSPVLQMDVSEAVQYAHHDRGTAIFRKGDPPGLCYIILSGEVVVWNEFEKEVALRWEDEDDGMRASPSMKTGTSWTSPRSPSTRAIPPVAPAPYELREKCSMLASLFSMIAKHNEKDGRVQEAEVTSHVRGEPIVTLGVGAIFGEVALLNNNNRGATVTCRTDCEFLTIGKEDFDRILKDDMLQMAKDKLKFLAEFVPGFRNLSASVAENLQNFFTKKSVPKDHVFVEESAVNDGCFYFLKTGSVESYTKDYAILGGSSFRRLGWLLRGSAFGALPQNARSKVTYIARSTPCEVFKVSPENLRHFPDQVLRGIRDLFDQSMERRLGQGNHISAFPGVSNARRPGLQVSSLPSLAGPLARTRTSKIPRPLSVKILNRRELSSNKLQPQVEPSSSVQSSIFSMRQSQLVCNLLAAGSPTAATTRSHSTGILFQRDKPPADFEVFQIQPGECLAVRGMKPKSRAHRGLKSHSSLPSLS